MRFCALYMAPGIVYNRGMKYRRCGRSGVLLPEISLGLWHNFGGGDDRAQNAAIIGRAMELGICHFDLADNYGPPPGSAEERFGDLLQHEFASHRDEMFIATKAGHLMWDGPYGDWGSRKHLIAGLNQSLRRMKLDYVDVFYHHRPDPDTPIEETVEALVQIVRSGKALYVGLSKYPPALFNRACTLLAEAHVPCLLHQFRYNLLDRACEAGMLPAAKDQGAGSIVFSPLAQGMLTGKYLNTDSLPIGSRAERSDSIFLDAGKVAADAERVAKLHALACEAGIPLTQLALRWLLQRNGVSSVLVGARTVAQLEDCAAASGCEPLDGTLMVQIDNLK